jgi:hypothetical protein
MDAGSTRWAFATSYCAAITVAELRCHAVIGSIRRECTDYMIVMDEQHLRGTLKS